MKKLLLAALMLALVTPLYAEEVNAYQLDAAGNRVNPMESTGGSLSLVDENGNPIDAILDPVDGKYHMAVSMIQDVKADANNSSTDNLTSTNSFTFTGVGSSTLGVIGLQWNLKCDQNAIVYIEESDDDVNWDISHPFTYIASQGGAGAGAGRSGA